MKDLKKINKSTFIIGMVVVYVVVSAGYIVFNLWSNFKLTVMQQAFLEGRRQTVEELITQAQNKECQAFPVFSGDKKVELLNTQCLTPQAKQGQ